MDEKVNKLDKKFSKDRNSEKNGTLGNIKLINQIKNSIDTIIIKTDQAEEITLVIEDKVEDLLYLDSNKESEQS
jgi:hypothetical protein